MLKPSVELIICYAGVVFSVVKGVILSVVVVSVVEGVAPSEV